MGKQQDSGLKEIAAKLKKQLTAQTIELQGKKRELEIEAALEKVRVRTMAMRSSSELSETSVVLLQQLKELKINAIRTSVGIFDDANGAVEFWTTFSDKLEEIKVLDYVNLHIHPVLENTIPARKKNKPYALTTLDGEEVKKYYQTMSTYLSQENQLTYHTKEFFYSFFFPAGMLNVIAYQALSEEECQIMERFAGVFGMIYTRFSDLQKAEAQTREAKIESALERVRTVAMAMRTSNELLNVCESVFKELRMLGFSDLDLRNVQIVINNDEKGIYYGYQYSDSMGAEFSEVPYDVHPVIRHLTDKLRQSKDAFADIEISGAELEDWKGFVNSFPQKRDEKLNAATELHYYFYSVGIGALGVSSFEPLLGEQLNILKRLRNIFDLCYQRYADITLAEAQAREAKIEAALEKVRSRSLAMHKAEELKEVASVLRSEMGLLGVEELETSSIYILDDKGVSAECWYAIKDVRTSNGKLLADHMTLNLNETKVGRSMLSFYHSGEKQTSIVMKGENRKKWINYCATKSTLLQGYYGGEIPERTYHLLKFSNGYIGAASPGAISTESWNLLQRVTAVFSFAYTRFLDLQKAEAQAREARIETALEKIRAASLAMHTSNDLINVVTVLRIQMGWLGQADLESSIIHLYKDNANTLEAWWSNRPSGGSDNDVITGVATAPLDSQWAREVIRNYKSELTCYLIVSDGAMLKEWYRVLARVAPETIEYDSGGQIKVPEILYYHFSKFSGGALLMITESIPSTEATYLQRRGAAVFNLAYQRFLDLQKAEAQAREAQIEASLERVRSRSMGMQKSEELKEVIQIVYGQFVHLNINIEHAGFVVDYKPKGDWHFWIADKQEIPSKITHPYFESVWANQFNKSKEEGVDFFVTHLNFEEKNKFYRELLSYIPDLPEESKQFYFSCPALAASTVLLENVSLYIENFSGTPYSGEENAILIRFGKVFEQTYTRFLDLQKAEAQARESQIQLALERVRARSLAMYHTNELQEIVHVVAQQLQQIGVNSNGGVFITINNEVEHDLQLWASSGMADYVEKVTVPVIDRPIFTELREAIKKGNTFFDKVYSKEEKDEMFQHLFHFSPWIKLSTERKEELLLREGGLTRTAAISKNTSIVITNHNGQRFSPKEIDILKRFEYVFEQAYTRFLDLQKAEAQTREAQIQLSLERVRARAMAMHKSDELFDLLTVLIDQFDVLGICPPYAHLSIIDHASNSFTFRISGNVGNRVLAEQVLDIDASPVWKQAFDTWKKGEYYSISAHHFPKEMMPQTWEMLKDFISMIPEEFRSKIEDFSDGLYITEASCKFGFLGYGHTRQSTPEEKDIIIRFTKEFERSYQRFLDLQKAEAQARESQIEAALERVRSRTMAMQHSNDLEDTAFLLFQQVQALDVQLFACGFNIWDDDRKAATAWMAGVDGIAPPFKTSSEEGVFFHIHEAAQRGGALFVRELGGEEMENHQKYMVTIPVFKKVAEKMAQTGISFPTFQITHCAFFAQGYLMFISYEPVPEAHDIFKRFAKVFEQTYTRFLDLQKAEAQAREAKIEAALERVRSRSMGMQKSEELRDVIHVIFEQFIQLGFNIDGAGFGVDFRESDDWNLWVADRYLPYPNKINIPYFDHPYSNAIIEAKRAGVELVVSCLTFEEKNKMWDHVFKYAPAPEEAKKLVYGSAGFAATDVLLKNVELFIENYAGIPYTDAENVTLMRFGKAFEQTYTRFNDLQKAEAQAREAKIEAALEKVRSRSLAMHKSDELNEVVAVVYEKLEELNFSIDGAAFIITFTEGSKEAMGWLADNHNQHYTTCFRMPYYDSLTINDFWKAKESGLDYFSKTYSLEEKNKWFDYAFEHTDLKNLTNDLKSWILQQEFLTQSFAATRHSILGLHFHKQRTLTESEIDILKRFSKVFEQSYTRFLDLQKAEAQAREAQIQLALERVRARTMAMQRSEELPNAALLMFQQLQALGVPQFTCSFNIWDDDKTASTCWGAREDALATPFKNPSSEDIFVHILDAAQNGESLFVREQDGAELVNHYNYLTTIPEVKVIAEEMTKAGFSFPTFQIVHCAFFAQGYLMFITYSPVPEAHDIFKRFAKVFEQTYTRFLDLQKAEAQAREAQIEAALEKVRSRSLAMHKSEELQQVVNTVFDRMNDLAIEANTASIVIYRKDSNDMEQWIQNEEKTISSYMIAPFYEQSKLGKDLRDSIAGRKDLMSMRYSREEKNEWFAYVFEHSDFRRTSDVRKKFVLDAESYCISIACIKTGAIALSRYSNQVFTDKENDILKRFARVFEQAYTRFLDLQKAEAQAREAKIEAALERVRSRTMAMQKSSELAEVATLLFQQVKTLGITQWTCGFSIFEIDDKEFIWYPGGPNGEILPPAKIPLTEHPVFISFNESRKRGDEFYMYEKAGEVQADHYRYMLSLPGVGEYLQSRLDAGEVFPAFQIDHLANFSHGNLYFITYEHFPEMHDVFKRFGKVFEQTYTRFLDLQKAEAQAREAQIEAALERVRSRSMGMQKSEELRDVIQVVYEQFVQLGLNIFTAGFYMDIQESNDWNLWVANAGGASYPTRTHIPYLDHPIFHRYVEAKEKGLDAYAYSVTYHSEEKNKILKHWIEQNPQNNSAELLEWVYSQPGWNVSNVIMKNVGLYLFNFELTPFSDSDNAILLRFAKVFEQTYTRFLDLQKAEAQAREATIEAALEKVRSRSLGMHVSQDLHAVVTEVFGQLEHLEVAANSAQIHEMIDDKTALHLWIAANGQVYIDQVHLPIIENKFFTGFYEAVKNGCDFFTDRLTKSEKDEFFHHYFKHWEVPKERQNFILSQEELNRSCVLFKNTALTVLRYDAIPYTSAENEVIKRFGYVFEQAYTRFLDLQKAEAQAHEALIEASLERVRGKAMAMHNSEDLAATIGVFYRELETLSITPRRCGVGLLDKEHHTAELSTMNTKQEGGTIELIGKMKLIGHPVLEGIYDNWILQKEYHPVLQGTEIKEYYQVTRPQIAFPEYPNDAVHFGYFFYFSEGGVYAWTEKELNEDELKTYRRFTSVLSLTYKRYKDLKDAEAREKEAIRQASLDRVRGEIASMRTTGDLERITPLVWRELTTLGIPFVRCGVFLMDDVEEKIHTFLSTPDGKAIAAFHLRYNKALNLSGAITNWREHKSFVIQWLDKDFQAQADTLVQQGSIANREQYLSTIPKEGIHLHFLPFLQGMLYVGNTSALNEYDLHLVQSVADAFSTAYARYEDFNKLEVAKQQVDKTLTDLKQAQKQLIQSEKMASLGELTAGIAHEIQNPLNFVNNFSEVSKELLDEMKTELEKGNTTDAQELANDVIKNLEKINHHGKRADAIVKGMLQHSRSGSGVKEPTDINALCDEYLRLTYHGLRAKDKSFNAKFETDFDNSIGKVNVISQDIGRVVLNLLTNAFYTVNERANNQQQTTNNQLYEPTVTISTKKLGDKIEIRVTDNGNGIPQKVLDKIFQPFFTTKPTGQGTGLGLSLSYDIVTKGHGGELKVETKEGEGSAFIIAIPN